jgi:protein tyrosine phosphatase (PTP) superfamily phosphohydrolase (DUF442 family)
MRVANFISRNVSPLGLAVLMTASTGCRISANFHTVDEGKVYRSAQLTGKEIEKAVRAVGLKAILNLRGAAPGKDWYDEEVATAKRLGLVHASVRLSAIKTPSHVQIVEVLNALRDLPRPLLIHCQAGADRTGLTSAIYQLDYMKKSKRDAAKMLDAKYLHLKLFAGAMDYFFDLYQGPEWARDAYHPCLGGVKYFNPKDHPECGASNAAELTAEEDS